MHERQGLVRKIVFGLKPTSRIALTITERCVFQLTKDGLTLTEIAPGVDLKKDIRGSRCNAVITSG